jgi:hypothetical protein
MPTYDFINTETGEQFSKLLKFSERDSFLEENPHIKQQILAAPRMVRGTSTNGIKNDDGWNENLSRIAEAHPNSALAEKVGGRSTTNVKVNEVAKKNGYGKSGSYSMEELNHS